MIPLTISDSQHNHRLLSVILKLARRSDAQHPRTAQRADGHRDIFVHGIHDPPTAVRPLGSLSTDGQAKSRASAGALLQILITSLIFCGDSCYFACSPLTGNHRMAVLGLMQPSMNSSTHPSIPISSLFLVAALKSAAHRPSFHSPTASRIRRRASPRAAPRAPRHPCRPSTEPAGRARPPPREALRAARAVVTWPRSASLARRRPAAGRDRRFSSSSATAQLLRR